MKVNFDVPDVIVTELMRRHLEDREPVSEKIEYLIDLGWRSDEQLRDKRVIVAIPQDTHVSYRRNLNGIRLAGEFNAD